MWCVIEIFAGGEFNIVSHFCSRSDALVSAKCLRRVRNANWKIGIIKFEMDISSAHLVEK